MPVECIILDTFGWFSGLLTLGLYVQRHRFLNQSESKQKMWIAGIWIVHLIAFTILMILAW